METLATFLVVLVCGLHVGFMVLESFLWAGPVGIKVFKHTEQEAQATRLLALNQGAYNGLLGSALFWAWATGRGETCAVLLLFVVLAGIVGGVTVARSILVIQGLPALLALIAVYLTL